ncbi:MAG: hypothetical protein ACYDER_03150 [Ktedonobacteraceae bacterium]
MDESVFQQPTSEQLHRFGQGDPLAIDEVVGLVLPQLYTWAERRYHQVPEHERKSVIHDVLSETCKNYARFNPSKAKFTTYVIELIGRRMQTVRRKQAHIMQQESSIETSSENLANAAYNDGEDTVIRRLDREDFYRRARFHLSPVESAFLDLMLKGEIHQTPFVVILEGASISTANMSREVVNTKERVKYKLERFAKRQGLRLEDLL